MLNTEKILKSPVEVAADPDVNEPIRLVLEEPPDLLRTRLRATALACAALFIAAGVLIWLWGYPRQQNNPGFWHVTLVSLLFWLSVTQGMVALSAILRLSHASWRYSLNRLLDMASLFGLWVWALLPLLILARQRIYALGSSDYRDNVWRVAGPAFFDALAVGTLYAAGWLLLYLTSLPDFAVLRDRAPEGAKARKLYARLARFWTGAEKQWRTLRRAEGVLVVGVLVAFVGSQTVLGWDFQLASARDWDSSIFAPLYTLGSLLGATALLVLIMIVTGHILHGRGFFTAQHYNSLGGLMIGLGLIWFYFRWCDYLTAWYGHIPAEWAIQNNRVIGFPILAGLMVFGCFIAPVFGNMFRVIRTSNWGLGAISVFVLIGLAVQRYLDTVPTFAPNYPLSALAPTVPGFLVFLGLSAMFVLTYLISARYIPVISWWGMGKERTRTAERKFGNTTVTVMVEDPPVWET
jgi:hypothetical protein